ncbi:hypothetical protein E3226_006820 [Legionella geestiana]|uniref:LysM peptidoglycan-binding domain-containing protein n=1 Tax=Legionella geestiana TaxID=45065 RepID=UPI0010923919|nr:LysM peptidoglycan-binding domain-containing protein [Legionella geestiana]QDQ40133.1 hypothetical protein E3226_006820 [Legionella geestiana]
MTQIITGNGAGVYGSSLNLPGNFGIQGRATLGQGTEDVYVNAANGNLVVRHRDGFMAGNGTGFSLTQTWNSSGESRGWRFNTASMLILQGVPNTPGSAVVRVEGDGHRTRFVFDAASGSYRPEEGGRASLSFNDGVWRAQSGSDETVSEYNAEGRLQAIRDRDGHSLRFEYVNNLLSRIVDTNARQTVTWHFEAGRLRDVESRSDGVVVHREQFEWDGRGRLARVVRDLGDGKTFWTRYAYAGESERISDIEQSDGTLLHIEYDTAGRVSLLRDGTESTMEFRYSAGKTTITNALNEVWTYLVDARSRLIGIEGPNGYQVHYAYEGNYLSSVTRGQLTWRYHYTANGDCERIEDPSGKVTEYTFDEAHRWLSKTVTNRDTKALISVERQVFDANGHLCYEVSAAGVVRTHSYDASGRLKNSRTFLNAHFTGTVVSLAVLGAWCAAQNPQQVSRIDYTWDWRGQLESETYFTRISANGEGLTQGALVTRMRYDAAGRLLEKSVPFAGGFKSTTYVYDDLDRLILSVNNDGGRHTYTYDDLHQRVIETDEKGLQTVKLYDQSGLLLSTTQLDSVKTFASVRYHYDATGRLVHEQGLDGLRTYYFYDASGQLQAEVSGSGLMTEYLRDSSGRLVGTVLYAARLATRDWGDTPPELATVRPLPSSADRTLRTHFNAHNQIAFQVDASGAVRGFEYDTAGRVVCERAYVQRQWPPVAHADDRVHRFYFDADGNRIADVDGEGVLTVYRYDGENHLLETYRYANRLRLPAPAIFSSLDLKPDTLHDVRTLHFYNAAGLKIADIDAEGGVTEYSFDDRGLMISSRAFATRVDMAAITANTTFDQLRPKESAQDRCSAWQYDSLARVVEEQAANGLVTRFSYDAQGLLICKTLMDAKTHQERTERIRRDSAGRVIETLDALGSRLLAESALDEAAIEAIWQHHGVHHAYDASGRRVSSTNAKGETTHYFYDDAGRLCNTINADGAVLEYRYNAFGDMTTTIRYSRFLEGPFDTLTSASLAEKLKTLEDRAHDAVITYDFDAMGRIISETHGARETTVHWNAFGEMERREQRINAESRIISEYRYDNRGLKIAEKRTWGAQSFSTSSTYDSFGAVSTETDARGFTSYFTRNRRGECVLFTAGAVCQVITWDTFGRKLTETDFSGKHVLRTFRYDDQQNQMILTVGNNVQISTANAFGDTVSLTDGNGHTIRWQFDERGLLVEVDDMQGCQQTLHYDDASRLSWKETRGGAVVQYHYDAAGNVLSECIDPEGLALTTTWTLDALGRQIAIQDAAGTITRLTWDAEGALSEKCVDPDGLNLQTHYCYDALGNLVLETLKNPGGKDHVVQRTWDGFGNLLTTTIDPNGLKITRRMDYDGNGNCVAETDPNQHTTHFVYDSNNRCRYRIDPRGAVTEHQYDVNGFEVATLRYANRLTGLGEWSEATVSSTLKPDSVHDLQTFRTFDEEGRIRLSWDTLGFATENTYDAVGNVVCTTRYAIATPLDALRAGKRELSSTKDARRTFYVYDKNNQLRYQFDATGAITRWTRDGAGNITESTRFAKPIWYGKAATLDEDSITRLLEADALHDQTTRITYDKAGRKSAERDATGAVTQYQYDAVGRCIATLRLAERVTESQWPEGFCLSPKDRLTRVMFDAAGREVFRIAPGGEVIERQYDAAGNVTTEIFHGLRVSASATPADIKKALLADTLSRRTDFLYDAAARLSKKTNAKGDYQQLLYDDAGNVTERREENGAVWRFVWDSANQLLETISPAVSLARWEKGVMVRENRSIITRNTWDSFGNLVEEVKDAEGLAVKHLYAYDGEGRKIRTLIRGIGIYGASTLQASAERLESVQDLTEITRYNAFGEVSATCSKGGVWRYHVYDERGQRTFEIDGTGHVVRYEYNALSERIRSTAFAKTVSLAPGSEPDARLLDRLVEVNSRYDRHTTYAYDALSRLVETTRDKVRAFDAKRQEYQMLSPCERQIWNAFGEITETATRRFADEWLHEYRDYDVNGHEIACLNAAGYLTTSTYTVFGELASQTDYAIATGSGFTPPADSSRSRTVSFMYDALGRVSSKTLKQVTFYHVDAQNRLQQETRDLETRFTWDAAGNLIATEDALGNIAYSYYNLLGQKIADVGPHTEAGRAATVYAYDGLGQLLSTLKRANGALSADAKGFNLAAVSAKDTLVSNVYDAMGRVIQVFDTKHHAINYSYDADGNLARRWQTFTRVDGTAMVQDVRYRFDAESRLTKTLTLKPDGTVASADTRYNAFGEKEAEGVNGRFTFTSDYDQLGRVWRTNTSGAWQINVYDLVNNVTQVVTASNAETPGNATGVDLSQAWYEQAMNFDGGLYHFVLQRQNNTYDASGNLLSQRYAKIINGQTDVWLERTQQVDRWGNVVREESVEHFVTTREYNALNALVMEELPLVRTVDRHGQATSIKPRQYFATDALGRDIGLTDAGGHTVLRRLDAEGHIIEEVDAKGAVSYKTWDLLGQMTHSKNATGVVVEYEYDKNGQLTSILTNGRRQTRAYDELGQLVRQSVGSNDVTTFEYNVQGFQTRRREASGKDTHWTYDDEGHKKSEFDGLHTQTWEYDDMGRIKHHEDLGGHRTTIIRNVNGLVLREGSTAGKHVQYQYYADGLLREFNDINCAEHVEYTYDAAGRVKTHKTSKGGDFKNGWSEEDETFSYDALGRLTSMQRRHSDAWSRRFPERSRDLLTLDYDYDAVGNIRHAAATANYTGKKVVSSDNWYDYDENDRLTVNRGVLENGNIGISRKQGSALLYDDSGNVREARVFEGENARTYTYFYEESGLLSHIFKDGNRFEQRKYDTSGRLEQTTSFDIFGGKTGSSTLEYKNGQVVLQTNRNGMDAETAKTQFFYDVAGNLKDSVTRMQKSDVKGKVVHQKLEHHYEYALWDEYLQSSDDTKLQIDDYPKPETGRATRFYDLNGLLKEIKDTKRDSKGSSATSRFWMSSLEGMHAREDETGMVNYVRLGDNLVGDVSWNGVGEDAVHVYGGFVPTGYRRGIGEDTLLHPLRKGGILSRLADFVMGRGHLDTDEAVRNSAGDANDVIPSGNSGIYTLEAGDTLDTIALKVYGDSSLWYLIADANGITERNASAGAGGQLQPGQRLQIPSIGNTPHFNGATRALSSQSKQIGSRAATVSTPKPLVPKHHKSHQLFQKIAVAVIALVTTVLAAAALASGFGASATAGIFQLGLAAIRGAAGLGVVGAMATSAGAGFMGNLVAQNVSEALGMQHGIDWSSLLASGLASLAVTGLGFAAQGSRFAAMGERLQKWVKDSNFSIQSASQTMIKDALNQSANLAFHNQQHFDWMQLGTHAATSGIMDSTRYGKLDEMLEKIDATGTLAGETASLASHAASALTHGKSFNAEQVLVDNLGTVAGRFAMQGILSRESSTQSEYISPLENISPDDGVSEPLTTAVFNPSSVEHEDIELAAHINPFKVPEVHEGKDTNREIMARQKNINVNNHLALPSNQDIAEPINDNDTLTRDLEFMSSCGVYGGYVVDAANIIHEFMRKKQVASKVLSTGVRVKSPLYNRVKSMYRQRSLEKAKEVFPNPTSASYRILNHKAGRIIPVAGVVMDTTYVFFKTAAAYSRHEKSPDAYKYSVAAGGAALADVFAGGAVATAGGVGAVWVASAGLSLVGIPLMLVGIASYAVAASFYYAWGSDPVVNTSNRIIFNGLSKVSNRK